MPRSSVYLYRRHSFIIAVHATLPVASSEQLDYYLLQTSIPIVQCLRQLGQLKEQGRVIVLAFKKAQVDQPKISMAYPVYCGRPKQDIYKLKKALTATQTHQSSSARDQVVFRGRLVFEYEVDPLANPRLKLTGFNHLRKTNLSKTETLLYLQAVLAQVKLKELDDRHICSHL